VNSHQKFDYCDYYSSLLAIYRLNTLHSQREQFWGRAALAPVILIGSGRFSLRAKTFPQSKRVVEAAKSSPELAAKLVDEKSRDLVAHDVPQQRRGLRLCARSRIRWIYGFLYNERVRVRKEDHGWIGCFGSERCKL
jgi:hypothetical protein